MLRVLILGGTTEASALARALAGDGRFDATVSLAGRTKAPVLPRLPSRVGGFGGVAGLVNYLRAERVAAVVDATHPFAAQMTRHAVAACSEVEVALLRLDRPQWQPGPDDRWTMVDDMAAAARALGEVPRRVWLTIGQKDLAPFKAAPWHRYLIRSVDAPAEEALPPGAEVITARGPFDEAAETVLLRDWNIEVLVTKNSGGEATRAKLAAARGLGIEVIMLRRPPAPVVETVGDVDAALAWLVHHAASMRRGV